jgi:hypothetical protein
MAKDHSAPGPRTRPFGLSRLPALVFLVATTILLSLACGRGGRGGEGDAESTSLLTGKQPTRVQGVRNPERLNDDAIAPTGDHWNGSLSAVFASSRAFVEYDLGQEMPIWGAFVQGDNNDTYVISGSTDGTSFTPIWRAPTSHVGGLQARSQSNLDKTARYIRISAEGGDGSYALTEVQLYPTALSKFPPDLRQRQSVQVGELVRSKTLVFVSALAGLLFLTSASTPLWWKGLLLLLTAATGYDGLRTILEHWPVSQRDISLIRALSALAAAMAVVREVFAPPRLRASRLAVFSVLGVSATLAVLSFYNLGRPQFWDRRTDEPAFIHCFDMRVYYPVAKYFRELRFDGLYLASVAAYAEDGSPNGLRSLGSVQLRDLRTHRMVRVSDVRSEVEQVKERFSPERWTAFKSDMRYFWEKMGVGDYLGSMRDHGGNATPVWFSIVYLLFGATTASDLVLGIGAALDPLLLALAFGMVGWVFGLRTMLVSMVIFGANDFYMFGSNWAGATLRHDWMAYLALGACALKKRHFALGGALLALSSMIRAFPAVALMALIAVALYWAYEHWREHGRLPKLPEIRETQAPLIRIVAGAFVCTVLFVGFSSILFGADIWIEWLHKVSLLSRDPHVNHISLRSLIAGSEGVQARVLQDRWPVFAASLVVLMAALLLVSRHKRPEQVAMLGLLLIPIVFYPANYYIHFVFLVPLAATELKGREKPLDAVDAAMWLSLLGVCTVQYLTTLTKDLDLHFYSATVVLFSGIVVLLFVMLSRDWSPLRAGMASALPQSLRDEAALGTTSAVSLAAEEAAPGRVPSRPSGTEANEPSESSADEIFQPREDQSA